MTGVQTCALPIFDPNIASNVIQQQVNAAKIGAEAARAGVSIAYGTTGPAPMAGAGITAMQLAGMGITQSQAAQGFQTIAQQQPGLQSIASRYQGYGAPQGIGAALESATFGTEGAAAAEQRLQRLKTQEVSAFSGSSGVGKGSLMGTEEGAQ